MPKEPLEGEVGELGEFASPACLMHEVDPVYVGLALPLSVERTTNCSGRCGGDATPQDEIPTGGTAPPDK